MKILITEEQYKLIKENSLMQNLIDQIKENGVEDTVSLVGDFDMFCQLLNINGPMDFLHLFDDLKRVRSEERPNWILFRYKPKHIFMIYDTQTEGVHINYNEIWGFLRSNFGLTYQQTRVLTEEWLDEVYNIRGVITISDTFQSIKLVE